MGDGMTTAASLLRGLVDKCITVDAIRATIANLVVLYCGLVERNWDFFQQHHSGMLITLNVIMVGLNDYMQQLLRRGRVRCGLWKHTCAHDSATQICSGICRHVKAEKSNNKPRNEYNGKSPKIRSMIIHLLL